MPTTQRFYGLLDGRDVVGVMRDRGAYVAGTAYLAGDVLTVDGSTFVVLVDHTAPATFTPGANYRALGGGGAAAGPFRLVRVVTDAATDVPLRITGAAGQSANMLEVLNNAGAARFVVGPAGQLIGATGNTTAVGLTVNALAGTTVDLAQWQLDSVTVAALSAAGVLTVRGLRAASTDPAAVPLVVTAAAAATANAAEVRASNGALMFYVGPTGQAVVTPTTTSTALTVSAPTGTPNANNVVAVQLAGTTVASVRADGVFTGRNVWARPTADTVAAQLRAGTATATSDLTQWQAFDGTVLARVTAVGALRPAQFTTATLPSAATAGAGAEVFDTTRGMTLVSNGTAWRTTDGGDPTAGAGVGQGGRTALLLGMGS